MSRLFAAPDHTDREAFPLYLTDLITRGISFSIQSTYVLSSTVLMDLPICPVAIGANPKLLEFLSMFGLPNIEPLRRTHKEQPIYLQNEERRTSVIHWGFKF